MKRKLPKNSVYTRSGDDGSTRLCDGSKHDKDEIYFEVLGHLDELNVRLSQISSAMNNNYRLPDDKTFEWHQRLSYQLTLLQHTLFKLSLCIATPSKTTKDDTTVGEREIVKLEEWIDEIQKELPSLNNSILPIGGNIALACHSARCQCRLVERRIVTLTKQYPFHLNILTLINIQKFINRLGDYLFVCARKSSTSEIVYDPNKCMCNTD